jgi:hypothetical protein
LVALLQIHELSVLAPHNVCWDMLRTEGFTELGPLDLISGVNDGEVGPPCSCIA